MKNLIDDSNSLRREKLSLLAEKERRQGLKDLFYFDKFILGFQDFDDKLHGELCTFTSNPAGKRKKLVLLPRGTFKSTAITIGQALWEVVKNPDIRILIDSEKMQNSSKFLGAIKGIIETNKGFRSLYGDLSGEKKGYVWSQYEATVAARKRHDLKEPTFSTAGVDVVKVGMHYDLIILDDPVSENNVTTKEQIEKVINHYKFLLSILEPTGKLIIIGTRWDYGDLYGYIIEDEGATFDIMVKQAEWDDEVTGEHRYLFPKRLTPEFLAEIKTSQGSYIYGCQYLNEPTDKDNAIFRLGWLRYYDGDIRNGQLYTGHKPAVPLNIFILIDPAISTEKTADYSALVAVGVDQENNLYVLDYRNERLNPFELDDAIFQMVKKWEPIMVGLEHHANQSYFAFTLPEQMKKRSTWFRIEELKPFGDKESRIRRLQPMFESGSVYLRKEHKEIVDQLLRFPFARHDDLIDALGYAPDLCYPKRKKALEEEDKKYYPISIITGY